MGLRRPPYAFTDLGVAMLSSELNSQRAVQMNILIMRAFVQLREVLAINKGLAHKLEQLERTQRSQFATFNGPGRQSATSDKNPGRQSRSTAAA